MNNAQKSILESTPGGGEVEKPYRYMPSQRVWFVDLFGPKTGINFSLESRWFSSELRERMSVFIVSILNEKDRNRNMRIRNAFE